MAKDRLKETFKIKVKPNSRQGSSIEKDNDGILTVHTTQSAVEGKANSAAISLLAKYLNVPKSQFNIIRGHTSRIKIVEMTRQ